MTRPSLTLADLQRIQRACRIIELDMADGIQTASRTCSPAAAAIILVANLRRNMGSGQQLVADADLDQAVEAHLRDMGFLLDELGRPQ